MTDKIKIHELIDCATDGRLNAKVREKANELLLARLKQEEEDRKPVYGPVR